MPIKNKPQAPYDSTKDPRIPPSNIEAEQALLGGIIMAQAEGVARADDAGIEEDDFYREVHKGVFAAMKEIVRQGRELDAVTLKDQIVADGILDANTAIPYIMAIVDVTVTSAHIEHYAEIVKKYAVLRRAWQEGQEISAKAKLWPGTKEEFLAYLEERVGGISGDTVGGGGSGGSGGMAGRIASVLDKLSSPPDGILTGWRSLDRLLYGGMQKGEYVILAARPGQGKSVMMMCMALHASYKQKRSVGVITGEMTPEQLTARLLSRVCRIDGNKFRATAGDFDQAEIDRIDRWSAVIEKLPMEIQPMASGFSLVKRQITRMARQGREIVFVDYLQKVRPDSPGRDAMRDVRELSHGFQQLALTLGIRIVMVQQLNRALEHRLNDTPGLADLRDAGEEDGSIIMFLKQAGDPVGFATPIDVIVAKNKDGQTGDVRLWFEKKFSNFAEVTK